MTRHFHTDVHGFVRMAPAFCPCDGGARPLTPVPDSMAEFHVPVGPVQGKLSSEASSATETAFGCTTDPGYDEHRRSVEQHVDGARLSWTRLPG